jgi:UDP-N-acetylglucosamine diphosphorylase/glucosamine-1-phosphate N-acetyltransferase
MESDLPKVLHSIGGEPMLKRVIDVARNLGAQKIIPVIGYQYEMVQNALKNETLDFAFQLEQNGTGHAVNQCRAIMSNFEGNVLILSGDVPLISIKTLKKLIQTHSTSDASATLLTADFDDPTGYGRVVRNKNEHFEKIVEHKDASDEEKAITEINAGIYVFDSKLLFKLLPQVRNNNAQGEYYLPDVIPMIKAKKYKVAIEKTENISEIQGVNTTEQLKELDNIWRNR